MDIFFVQLLYFLRPMLNAELVDWSLLGFSFFELAAILLFLLLMAAFSLKLMHKTRDPVSGVEVWATLLILWCTISYVVHIEISSAAAYLQLIMPLMTYIMVKRILPDRSAHARLVFIMLIGFLLPFAISAVMTYQGQGLGMVVYWTGTERYKGVYANIHNMGHNAGFAMMLTVVYVVLRKKQEVALHWGEAAVVGVIFVLGAYLLFHSHVRTVYVGLAVFLFVGLFFYSKQALALSILLSIAVLAFFWDTVSTIFFDIVEPLATGEDFDRVGSGRIAMYKEALATWREAPLINQLTGMGLGNTTRGSVDLNPIKDVVRPWGDPHNDWLFALMSLGVVGMVFLVGLYASIFQALLKVCGKEKSVLLGLFAAVLMMNLVSNSYISRVSMAQMFLMIMVYVDLRSDVSDKKA